MSRRLWLLGFMNLVRPGTVLQLVMPICFCVLYLGMQIQASPFKSKSDGALATTSSALLVLIFLMCLVFKFNSLTDQR